jgi:hypothetical protein
MAKSTPTAAVPLAASMVVMVEVFAEMVLKYPVKHGLVLPIPITYATNDISLVRIFQVIGR